MLKLFSLMMGAALACVACGTSVDNGAGGGGGGGGDGAGEADTSAQIEAACELHSVATCTKELECVPGRLKIIGPAETCAERMKARCVSRFDLPGSGLTAAGLEACASVLAADGCGMFTDFPAECAFTGQLNTGEACSDDAQCASGKCSGTKADPCGTCEASSAGRSLCLFGCNYGKPGCGYPTPGPSCSYGEECNGDHCWDAPQDGGSCSYDADFCVYPASCADETCTLEAPVCP